ncbi:uncharacterized protein LOC133841409 [Drosophila sulfurigaster albostrigata]|uniref:uncharacterized protein LOC133841409 n=1 Tax=Drosophila sulfurigaster albostrigata TaxID=89887 RepID=UPI002D21C49A|nr:uncharacterized protein LOC133841409 [Drosophila sulfurigaster albostrigata]
MSSKSIREVQQSFAESLGFGNETIWDLLSNRQSEILKKKIRTLIPDPEKKDKQCAVFARIRQTLFDAVWEQRKYTNRQSLTSIFYVLVATDETNHNRAMNSTNWSCHPVFRARRCVSDINGRCNNSVDCCMIYVDENGRVYQNWESYLDNNELPEGIMVAPRRGVYNLTSNGSVILQSRQTPAAGAARQVLGALDTASAVGGLGATAVPVIGLMCTVAAPIVLTASIVGLACAGYSTIRAGAQLVDRSQHEQSINVTDRTARGQWLGVVGGVVGLGASGATTAATAATNAGRRVGTVAQWTVNGMNISSIAMSATGISNGIIDLLLKHDDGDDISALDVLQLSASLFLFTHSLYNFQLASSIIDDTSNERIGSYRKTLSNRQRRMFDKMVKETTRIKGVRQANVDIIRNVNDIPSRQQFNDLYKINTKLKERDIIPSFAAKGKGVLLNGQVITNAADLRANVQHNIGPDIIARVTNPKPETFQGSRTSGNNAAFRSSRFLNGPIRMRQRKTNGENDCCEGLHPTCELAAEAVLVLPELCDEKSGESIISEESYNTLLLLSDKFDDDTMHFVLQLTATFLKRYRDGLHEKLQFYISSESVLYRIGTHILDKYRSFTVEKLEMIEHKIMDAIYEYFISLNPNNYRGKLNRCDVCKNFYKICEL